MPNKVSKQLVKTEFLVDKLEKLMDLKHKVISTLTLDTRPDFNGEELKSITSFLMAQLADTKYVKEITKPQVVAEPKIAIEEAKVDAALQCKSCGEKSDYSAQYGRYGYFIKCNKCETNTAMKMPCASCDSKNTKVSKKKETYTLICSDCEKSMILL
jgi:CRISPR/Cas system CMR-associated protein Cmr3 (group 5 of RAMP superfamily)